MSSGAFSYQMLVFLPYLKCDTSVLLYDLIPVYLYIMYVLCAQSGHLSKILDDLEMFSLLVAALSHNVDHLGFTNCSLMKSEFSLVYVFFPSPSHIYLSSGL